MLLSQAQQTNNNTLGSSMAETNITPTRPYLTRAIYEWIEDNQLTAYLLVDATQANVSVPTQHVKDGQIVLNIAARAVHKLLLDNDYVSFSARFGGVSREVYVPFSAVLAIYAKENGQGLFFDPNEYQVANLTTTIEQPDTPKPTKKKPVKNTAGLRVLD